MPDKRYNRPGGLLAACVGLLAFASAGAAHAQSPTGTKIEGETKVTVTKKTTSAQASVDGSTTAIAIGASSRAEINRSTTINATGSNVTTSVGSQSCAESQLGAINPRKCQGDDLASARGAPTTPLPVSAPRGAANGASVVGPPPPR